MKYYAVFNNGPEGPYTTDQLIEKGLKSDTYVWYEGLAEWRAASSFPELVEAMNGSTPPPFPGERVAPPPPASIPTPPYYPIDTQRPRPYNWLTWAIIGTIGGFLCCMLGMIPGIVGIVQANSAQSLYRQGMVDEAYKVNSTAKTWTIVSLVLCGLSLIGLLLYIFVMVAIISSAY